MKTHDEIDELLAADLHEQLDETERQELHAHLIECVECRQLHKEHQAMNRILTATFEEAKPDPKFEQRMLGTFRARVPYREPGVMRFLITAMRSRATQIAAAAALLLALVQTGRLITGEGVSPKQSTYLTEAPLARSRPIARTTTKDGQDASEPPAQPFASAGSLTFREPAASPQTKPTDAIAGRIGGSVAATKSDTAVDRIFNDGAVANERVVTGSNIPTADQQKAEAVDTYRAEDTSRLPAATNAPTPPATQDSRKLIRNAAAELEVRSFEETVQQITGLAMEARGYIATSSSNKQSNGKLRGQVVAKVLPESLDAFLAKLRGLGELKNQTLGTEDVTKQYFDTEARLKNQRAMEQRLLELLKTNTNRVSDLLEVEKELGRVREAIEKMQGELKYMDAQVAFATVTIQLAEKDMNVPAAFLLKERARLALYVPDVEKTYGEIKSMASPNVQITNATIDRDSSGRVSARISMLIAPDQSEAVTAKAKSLGRVENFQVQTDRVARGGEGMSAEAQTERDKVELNITISRDEQEQARQQTTLSIRTVDVNDRTKQLRDLAEKQIGRIRASSFSRDPNGREYANVSLRVPMKNYSALMQSLGSLGKLENISVHRDDRPGSSVDEANAPADVSIQVYSQGNIVSADTGLVATLRRTIAQGVGALMWSVRMIGVALAFFAPWVLALGGVIWLVRRVRRRRAG